jgi:hypothetical protein
MEDLNNLKDEYQEWRDNLPENLSSGALAEKLDEILNMDFERDEPDLTSLTDPPVSIPAFKGRPGNSRPKRWVRACEEGMHYCEELLAYDEENSDLQDLLDMFCEAEAADLPLGFGRD